MVVVILCYGRRGEGGLGSRSGRYSPLASLRFDVSRNLMADIHPMRTR